MVFRAIFAKFVLMLQKEGAVTENISSKAMIVKLFVLRPESMDRIVSLCADDTIAIIRPEKKLVGLFKDAITEALVRKGSPQGQLEAVRAYFGSLSDDSAFLGLVDRTISGIAAYLGEGMFIQASLQSIEDYVMIRCARLCAEAVNIKAGADIIDGTGLMICHDTPGKVVVDWNLSREQIRQRCTSGGRTIITGGYARTPQGYIMRIGKGGASLMASLVASAVQAEKLECYIEKDGIEGISSMTYDEAAHYCSSSLAPFPSATLWPAKKAGIPIVVLNISDPSFPGTLICSSSSCRGLVSGVLSEKDLVLITVYGTGLLGQVGMSSGIFSAMARSNVNVRFISQSSSEYSISFAVRSPDKDAAEQAIGELVSSGDDVMLSDRKVGIVTVYGDRMKNVPGVSGMIYSALGKAGINVVAAAQGGEELSISLVVEEAQTDAARKILQGIGG